MALPHQQLEALAPGPAIATSLKDLRRQVPARLSGSYGTVLHQGQEIRSHASERERTATALPARCPSEKACAGGNHAAVQDGSIS